MTSNPRNVHFSVFALFCQLTQLTTPSTMETRNKMHRYKGNARPAGNRSAYLFPTAGRMALTATGCGKNAEICFENFRQIALWNSSQYHALLGVAIENVWYGCVAPFAVQNLVIIGWTCRPCGAKNRKIVPWVIAIPSFLPLISIHTRQSTYS